MTVRQGILTGIVLMIVALPAHADTIRIDTPMSPPDWALLERALLEANSRACEAFAAHYLDERGYLLHTPRWGVLDGLDDAIETFHNWTFLYSLGGDESAFRLFEKAQEGHLQQYKELTTTLTDMAAQGGYYKEFVTQSDWLHIGESMRGFHFQGLCDPTDARFQIRTRRFAGLYMNEDPDAPNYDSEHRMIRSFFNGAKGPMLRESTPYDWAGDPVVGRFHILHAHPGIASGNFVNMLDFTASYPAMLISCDGMPYELHVAGDNPFNLLSTNLALNAYMLSHETKYRDWLLEYADAWVERIRATNGNIPTNIGLDGTIGGEFGGKWYKGIFGWDTKTYNLFWIGPWRGMGNAYQLTGDRKYLDVLRGQMDNLYAQKKIEDGKVLLPFSYTDEGWKDWRPARYNDQLLELWLWSMDPKDRERVNQTGWVGYLAGNEPDWPAQALRRDLGRVRSQVQRMWADSTTSDTRLADWPMFINPCTIDALYTCMLGGVMTGKWWGLHSRVRYFDPERRRSGLPPDVGALVTGMAEDYTTVELVNVNQVVPRTVTVQTGGYGEHRCIAVEVDGVSYPVDGRYFTVRLEPGAGASLTIRHERYAYQTTLAFPWHGETVPAP